jgi:putative ABC transport system substrate-binding protein
MVSDPVRMGHVESMSRPGGNVTGFTPFEPSLGGKWVELLREIAATATHAALLFNPDTAANALPFVQSAELGGRLLGMLITTAPVRSNFEVERIITEFSQQPAGGIILVPDPFTFSRIDLIVAATARHALPLITPFREYTARGAVLSYGVNQADEFHRTATYIDRILRGEKPAELPVQAPTRFALTINLKTAKALGLEIPPQLLARADEMIE